MVDHYFLNNDKTVFLGEHAPRLQYFSDSRFSQTEMPRPMHRHEDLFEINYIEEGCGRHFIDGRIYLSHPGDVLIYNQGVLHEDSAHEKNNVHMFGLGIENLHLEGLPDGCLLPADALMKIPCSLRAPQVRRLFLGIGEQVRRQKKAQPEVASMFAASILLLVRELAISQEQTEQTKEAQLAQRISAYIDEHFSEEISLETLEWEFKVSKYHIAHLFSRQIGYSPIQYLQRRRIGEAQTRLVFTDQKVIDIAQDVGFHSSSYFTRTFTKIVGMSPVVYREISSKSY
ncbi:MAG: AraC family transcriptional regulator [Eubacteriales bacterium]|nr:AraC family transcriptional regulator [Eubacteriales bacterium]